VPRASQVRALRFQQAQQPQATGYVIAAPVGGLNARDALANMPETDAIVLDNWFVQPSWVELRRGKTTLATFTGACQTVAAYNSLTGTNQLYAGVNNGGVGSVYRVDNANGGSAGAAVVGGAGNTIQQVTNTMYDWLQLGTGAAEVLYLVNGADNPLLYDGTTWRAITTVSAPYALTGGPSPLSSLSQVIRYKSRLWFVQANTFNVYYLPQNVFAGALTLLPMAPNFNLGGSLAMLATNSVDNAAGINDYMAFISTQGEVILYQGYDPAQVATWYEAGHFRIGRPLAIGRRGWQKIGSDAAVLCIDGLTPLSKALVADRSQPAIAITDKIRSDINFDANAYAFNFGWQVILYPMGTKLVINTPTLVNSTSYQYVQNTISGAWSTFGKYASPWNAICFETMGDDIYYGTVGSVAQCDTATSDDGASYLVTAKPAFSYMENREQLKIWTQCQPIFQVSGDLLLSINMLVDFDQTAATNVVPVSSGNSAVWNVAKWNTTFWGDDEQVVKPWIGLAATGYCGSMELRANVMGITAKWQSTNYIYKPGGFFYGVAPNG
jgi:hypothetical protein